MKAVATRSILTGRDVIVIQELPISAEPNATTSVFDTLELIDDACREFSRTTGWPLRFLRVPHAQRCQQIQDQLGADPDCCWHSTIDDGVDRIGFLAIGTNDGSRPNLAALSDVCDFAEALAELLRRIATVHRALDQHTDDVSTLADISRHAHSHDSLPSVLQHLLDAAVRLTGFRGVAFFILDTQATHLKLRATSGIASEDVPHAERTLLNEPPDLAALLDGHTRVQVHDGSDAGLLPAQMSMGMCFRVLQSQSAPLGILWAYDRRSRVPSDRECHVLESIATQIAGVLERVVLRHDSGERRRLHRAMEAAASVQMHERKTDQLIDPNCDVAAVCSSCDEIGGDLCEVIPIDEHRTVIAIGDATGHSVPAAIIMSSVRGCVRALTNNGFADVEDTVGIMRQINSALHSITPGHVFMSLVFGVLDSRSGRFVFTNAGHPKPLHYASGRFHELASHGVLLGVVPDAEYDSSEIHLRAGDMLIAFSDGITEARNRSSGMFRSEGIASAFDPQRCGSARNALDAILGHLETHTQGSRDDDRTLLVVRMADGFEVRPV